MPITMSTGVTSTKTCVDEDCEGHEPREIGVTLRTVAHLSRVGTNPATTQISKRELLVDVDDAHETCEFCGGKAVVDERLVDGRGYRVVASTWPQPERWQLERAEADETLPVPLSSLPMEERVARLEREVAALRGG
jgi:hypothetical protein